MFSMKESKVVVIQWFITYGLNISLHHYTEKYNRYVEAVGGKIGSGACAQQKRENKLDEISDDTKLIAYLSTHDGDTWQGDWLFHVIKDIVRNNPSHALLIHYS